jgi:hypothetical protein
MAFAAVTHCYFRHTYPSWPYNMYTMLHARSDRECRRLIRQLAEVSGVRDYKVLDTIKEFKKTKTDLKEILK